MRALLVCCAVLAAPESAEAAVTITGETSAAVGETVWLDVDGTTPPAIDEEDRLTIPQWMRDSQVVIDAPQPDAVRSRFVKDIEGRHLILVRSTAPGRVLVAFDYNEPGSFQLVTHPIVFKDGPEPPPPPPPPPPPETDLAKYVKERAEQLVAGPTRAEEARAMAADCRAIAVEIERARDPLKVWETELFTPERAIAELGRRWKQTLGRRWPAWQALVEDLVEYLSGQDADGKLKRTVYGVAEVIGEMAKGFDAVEAPPAKRPSSPAGCAGGRCGLLGRRR